MRIPRHALVLASALLSAAAGAAVLPARVTPISAPASALSASAAGFSAASPSTLAGALRSAFGSGPRVSVRQDVSGLLDYEEAGMFYSRRFVLEGKPKHLKAVEASLNERAINAALAASAPGELHVPRLIVESRDRDRGSLAVYLSGLEKVRAALDRLADELKRGAGVSAEQIAAGTKFNPDPHKPWPRWALEN